MKETTYPRRGLIKHGLTLVAGILVFGANRSNSAETKTAEPNKRTQKVNRGIGVRQHCIEGKSLGLPVQPPEKNKD
jgi:hypothetical protein